MNCKFAIPSISDIKSITCPVYWGSFVAVVLTFNIVIVSCSYQAIDQPQSPSPQQISPNPTPIQSPIIQESTPTHTVGTIQPIFTISPSPPLPSSQPPLIAVTIDRDQADPIGSWHTYINQNGKYQYSYPPNWQSNEPCPDFTGPKCGEGPQNRSTLNAPNSRHPDGFFSVEYFQEDVCNSFVGRARSWSWKEVEEIETAIDGSTALMFRGVSEFTDLKDYDREYLLTTNGNTCYVLDSWSLPGSEHRQILDRIISTFRFLDQQ